MLIIVLVMCLICLTCKAEYEFNGEEETVSALLEDNDVLACVIFSVISALLLQNYDYIHYCFLRDTTDMSAY